MSVAIETEARRPQRHAGARRRSGSLAIPLLKIGARVEEEQRTRLAKIRAERDQAQCDLRLDRLRQAARSAENTFPHILDCARAYCTLYEIRAAMETVFGAYREPVFF